MTRLYLITPPTIDDLDAFADTLQAALSAGDVACLQIRLKDASDEDIRAAVERLKPIAHAHEVAVLLNDDPKLARETGCDGVHIGQDDTPYKEAREIMGKDAIIGVTCHDSRHLAMLAAERGADYVAFGAFYPTDTKEPIARATPDILEIWTTTTNVPCVAIGGITIDNTAPLVAAGADFLAVVGGVWNHADGPAKAVSEFNRLLGSA